MLTAAAPAQCASSRDAAATIPLPVVCARTHVRRSRNSRWRTLSLVGVHVLIIGHVAQWLITGRTLSPVEPSETMYTLNEGAFNAGFIFLALALLATLIFGRFVCGWGCHVVAYQDLCAWLLKKAGIKPKPFRSRLLVLAPLALAFYMFFWPTVYRWFAGAPAPTLSNHLMTTEFWKTFPGPTIAIVTVAVCGFVIVYFLGSKGFCTYACPYGGLFGVVDKFAVGRIRVTDDCEHCGHCTAVCTSNVRVHEEVARYGMVVDPGCMKCMDCVSVCPNDALYFGLAPPSILGQTQKRRNAETQKRKPAGYDFTLAEELLVAGVGLGALLVYRGLYGQIPLLLAMGIAAILGYIAVKCLHMARAANVRLQNLQLKRGRRITRAGAAFVAMAAVLLIFTAHSAAVQWCSWSGQRLFASLHIGDEVWLPGDKWWEGATEDQRSHVDVAIERLGRVDAWGVFSTPVVLQDLAWLHLAKGDVRAAEAAVRRLIAVTPKEPEPHRGLAGILRKGGQMQAAEAAYRQALVVDPRYARARRDLAALLVSSGRIGDATSLYNAALQHSPDDAELSAEFGEFLLRIGKPDAGIEQLRRALSRQPGLTQARYQLAVALLGGADSQTQRASLDEAVSHLKQVVTERPAFAEAHYNLGVAVFMTGDPAAAIAHIRESIRLNPKDPQAYGFLEVVLRETGDAAGAAEAHNKAAMLRPRE